MGGNEYRTCGGTKIALVPEAGRLSGREAAVVQLDPWRMLGQIVSVGGGWWAAKVEELQPLLLSSKDGAIAAVVLLGGMPNSRRSLLAGRLEGRGMDRHSDAFWETFGDEAVALTAMVQGKDEVDYDADDYDIVADVIGILLKAKL